MSHYMRGGEHLIKSVGDPRGNFTQSTAPIQGFIDKAKRVIDDYRDRREESSTDDEEGGENGPGASQGDTFAL
jgi:hypothetical protein